MAKYVTLGPVSYVSGGAVIEVLNAGTVISLDSATAALLAGSISYLSEEPGFMDTTNGAPEYDITNTP